MGSARVMCLDSKRMNTLATSRTLRWSIRATFIVGCLHECTNPTVVCRICQFIPAAVIALFVGFTNERAWFGC